MKNINRKEGKLIINQKDHYTAFGPARIATVIGNTCNMCVTDLIKASAEFLIPPTLLETKMPCYSKSSCILFKVKVKVSSLILLEAKGKSASRHIPISIHFRKTNLKGIWDSVNLDENNGYDLRQRLWIEDGDLQVWKEEKSLMKHSPPRRWHIHSEMMRSSHILSWISSPI